MVRNVVQDVGYDALEDVRMEVLFRVYSWVQEHANLCTLLRCPHPDDAETRGRLEQLINQSLGRGSALVSEAVNCFSGLRTSAGSSGMVACRGDFGNMIPLSGSRRFSERALLREEHPAETSYVLSAGEKQRDGRTQRLLPSKCYAKKSS